MTPNNGVQFNDLDHKNIVTQMNPPLLKALFFPHKSALHTQRRHVNTPPF
ncbi:hypothetical protein VIBNISFn118_1670004 [Vibrio nigripulchritudo SFn118]|nr:hypothetical protein VIBNISFn118_1670004 [Vibrio nigripulchritudo SFn118]